MDFEIYSGSLSSKTRSGSIRTAYQSFSDQRSRCYNKNNNLYKHYGACGLTVDYSSREFVGWWLASLEKKNFKKPVCGRIDHAKSYSFDNIELQESSDNSRESITRNMPIILEACSKKILCFYKKKEFCSFKSIEDASRSIGLARSTVCTRLRQFGKKRRRRYTDDFDFKFYNRD